MSTYLVSENDLPVSNVSSAASSSLRSRRISTARRRMRERSMAVMAAQIFWPFSALTTARSTSSFVARCTVEDFTVSRVNGFEGGVAAGVGVTAIDVEFLQFETGHSVLASA